MNACRRTGARWILIAALPVLSSCESGTAPEVAGSIAIGGVEPELAVGATLQLVSTVFSPSGSTVPGASVSWRSSNSVVASVSSGGLVTGHSPGTTSITATSGRASTSVTLTVKPGACTAATAGTISVGQTRVGTLGPGDCHLPNYPGRAAGWTLELSTTTRFEIVVTTLAFWPELIVTDGQLNGLLWGQWYGEGATGVVGELPAGRYIVWPLATEEGAVGTYELSITQVNSCTEATAGSISVGETRTASLGPADCVPSDRYYGRAAGWAFHLSTTTTFRVVMSSATHSPHLVITDAHLNELLSAQWYGPGRTRILGELPAGQYIVWAMFGEAGAVGGYELSVTAMHACTEATAGSISVGQTQAGSLGPDDCTFRQAERAQGWSFELPVATGFAIAMTSSDFFPVLLVTDLDLNDLIWGAWDLHGVAHVGGELPAGQYIVWAMSNQLEATGGYELFATESSQPRDCDAGSDVTPIRLGETVTGKLDPSDCLLLGLTQADGYVLGLDEPTGVRIDLASGDFDALLVITDSRMEVLAWNDDWGQGTDSRIERRFPAGEYLVWALAFDTSFGSYELSVAEVEITLCPTVGILPFGGAVTGSLPMSDCVLDGAWYADPWALSVPAATTLRIDLTSGAFDTFLILEDAGGVMLDWDDDGGFGLNSRLVYAFPEGEYRIVVTSFDPWETGPYQLSTQILGSSEAPGLRLDSSAGKLPGVKSRTR